MSGVPNHALYAGSKSAVEGFVRSFSADAGHKGITVNGIAPGGIKTDMFSANAWHYAPGADSSWSIDDIEAGIAKLCPLKRVAVPKDISRVVAFLAHDDSEWINGRSKLFRLVVVSASSSSTSCTDSSFKGKSSSSAAGPLHEPLSTC